MPEPCESGWIESRGLTRKRGRERVVIAIQMSDYGYTFTVTIHFDDRHDEQYVVITAIQATTTASTFIARNDVIRVIVEKVN